MGGCALRVVGVRGGRRPACRTEPRGVQDGVVHVDKSVAYAVFDRREVGCAQLPYRKTGNAFSPPIRLRDDHREARRPVMRSTHLGTYSSL